MSRTERRVWGSDIERYPLWCLWKLYAWGSVGPEGLHGGRTWTRQGAERAIERAQRERGA